MKISTKLDRVDFYLIKVGESAEEIGGIIFSNNATIKIDLSGTDIQPGYSSGFDDYYCVLFSELELSLQNNGSFLIFTTVSGVTDAGDFGPVEVTRDETHYYWAIPVGIEYHRLKLDQEQLRLAVSNLKRDIFNLEDNVTFKPNVLFLPEEWENEFFDDERFSLDPRKPYRQRGNFK